MTNKLTFLGAALAALGACAVPGAVARDFTPEERGHWAFQRVARPPTPSVQKPAWARNPIDAFVLAQLEASKLQPSAPADRATLLRRASLDLLGLPPTPQQLDEFLADKTPDAFAKAVDRMLASPQYGERWARHWLDLARYAESEGFKSDETRPNAWRYRDYVIQSLNADKPYDRFVQEQIAGDELWPDDDAARIATTFNRHYPDESNARNLMQRRQEILNDITDAVGSVFLGMTYGCARCHDHKFDPILQTDYYRLQAFFANTAARDDVVLAPPATVERHRQQLALWEEKTREVRAKMEEMEAPKRRALEQDYFEKYPTEIQVAWNKPESERTPFERQMVWKAKQYLDPKSHEYVAGLDAVLGKFKPAEKKQWQELKKQLDEFADLHPGTLPVGSAMMDLGNESPKTHLLARGLYDKPADEVPPGLLQVIYREPARIERAQSTESTGRRTALARLLTDPQNPLTARVAVNRVWQYHFGRGLVGTSSDFGLKGDRPTHPALLDWLASEFIASGWSLKKLHRLILTSATYQQSSVSRDAAAKIDPQNKLLWRYPRQRLEGEAIRDSALAVAGMLNPKMGGPSVFPELPAGMPAPRGGWKLTEDESERNRRSIYVFVRRNTRYPLFDSFDMPDPHESCPRRNVTTSPLQALTLLNSKLTLEWARNFAGRVFDNAGADQGRQIEAAYRLAYARLPDKAEQRMAKYFFRSHGVIVGESAAQNEKSALSATLVDFCHMLINANEFVYVN